MTREHSTPQDQVGEDVRAYVREVAHSFRELQSFGMILYASLTEYPPWSETQSIAEHAFRELRDLASLKTITLCLLKPGGTQLALHPDGNLKASLFLGDREFTRRPDRSMFLGEWSVLNPRNPTKSIEIPSAILPGMAGADRWSFCQLR
ncbi:hypothetical protein PLICRDRAFT_50824 [Plicaturopsis crispa FD-325 SS-3]|nr:hypothetical protein PLICRDRAFT_50824 [Plicaturopsis crispa FD-325 SS-3]